MLRPFDHGDLSEENMRKVRVIQQMQIDKMNSQSSPTLTIEVAELAAIEWSQMSEDGTMHIRALRNILRRRAGLDPIPDTETVEPLTELG